VSEASARKKGLLRLAASLLLLVLTLSLVDTRELGQRLAALQPGFALGAALLATAQFPLLAWRWCLFARSLAVPLGFGQALGEYYLSTLLNQILPLGVMGDALRLLRHAERARSSAVEQPRARVALALALDRLSGQLGLWLVVLAVAPRWWPLLTSALRPPLAAAALLFAACLLVALFAVVRRRWQAARSLLRDGARALFAPRLLAAHLSLSLLLVASHVTGFVLVARALGYALPVVVAAQVVPPVLVASTLPGFFAGWGPREAAAAGLYHLSGLAAADGALVALCWGSLGLLVSTPGLWRWLKQPR
jgi:glycosyltransferase 2 family protein